MLRWMSEPQKRRPNRRTSEHGHPRGFDKPDPTEQPDPYQYGREDHHDDVDAQGADDVDGGEQWT